MPGAPLVTTTTEVPGPHLVSPGGLNHPWRRPLALQHWLPAASLLPAPGSADVVTDAAGKTPRARAFQAGLAPPVIARPGEIGLTRRSLPRRSVMPSEGQCIDLHVAKKLNDIPFCYLKRCLSNSIMERPGPGPGAPWPAAACTGWVRTRGRGRGPVFPWVIDEPGEQLRFAGDVHSCDLLKT